MLSMLIGFQGIPFVTWKNIVVMFLLEQMFCSSVCEPVGPCKNYHRRARNIPVNKMSAFYEPYLRLLDQFFS